MDEEVGVRPLPPEILEADRRLDAIGQRLDVAAHLNPTNLAEARRAWLGGRRVPPFTYRPLEEADALLAELAAVRPPLDHPLGLLLGRARDDTAIAVRALRDRTAAAFDAWNRVAGWYGGSPDTSLATPPARGAADPGPQWDAGRFRHVLVEALKERGWQDWVVRLDDVMSARVLVDGVRRRVLVRADARFRELDARTLVAHEIDVHVRRAQNGGGQALRLFATGTPGGAATEEGLALLAEEQVGKAVDHERHQLVLAAVERAKQVGFAEVFALLEGEAPGLGWGVAVRLKRGLAAPDEPGVFARDACYYHGYRRVRAWIAAGGDPALLFAAKVRVEDPLEEWVREGWLRPTASLPPWFEGLRAHSAGPGPRPERT